VAARERQRPGALELLWSDGEAGVGAEAFPPDGAKVSDSETLDSKVGFNEFPRSCSRAAMDMEGSQTGLSLMTEEADPIKLVTREADVQGRLAFGDGSEMGGGHHNDPLPPPITNDVTATAA
jgi:hypothetical protein